MNEAAYQRRYENPATAPAGCPERTGTDADKHAEPGHGSAKIVNDSIMSYIKEYNESHHYDAIFMKAATLYINPDLDITDEIIEGLNARYNKVKK